MIVPGRGPGGGEESSRGVYSDRIAPIGARHRHARSVAPAYAVSQIGRFQQRLWAHFYPTHGREPQLEAALLVPCSHSKSRTQVWQGRHALDEVQS